MSFQYVNDICNGSDTVFNLTDPDDAYHFLYRKLDKLLITVIIPVISLAGILGNSAFLLMCYRVQDLRKAQVTIYLSNLAVCDIFFLIATNAWYLMSLFSNPVNIGFPVNSRLDCAFWVISTHWWYPASLGFITLISFERYYAICYPLTCRKVTKARSLTLIIFTWIVSLLLTFTMVPQYGKFSTDCMIWPEMEKFANLPVLVNECEAINRIADIYGNCMAISILIITLVTNFVLFGKIITSLRHHAKKYRDRGQTNSVADRASVQVTRTLVANGIIFFICQLPFRIFTFDDMFDNLGEMHNSFDDWNILESHYWESFILLIGRAFLLLNSVINPFLYILSCQHYRQAFITAFCGSGCRNLCRDKYQRLERRSELTDTASNI